MMIGRDVPRAAHDDRGETYREQLDCGSHLQHGLDRLLMRHVEEHRLLPRSARHHPLEVALIVSHLQQ